MVPLRQVAEIVETTQPADHQARRSCSAASRSTPTPRAARRATSATTSQKIIKDTTLPPGYRFDVGGQQKDMAGVVQRGAGGARASR